MTTITPHADAAQDAIKDFRLQVAELVAEGVISELEGNVTAALTEVPMESAADLLDNAVPPDDCVAGIARGMANGMVSALVSICKTTGFPLAYATQLFADEFYAVSEALLTDKTPEGTARVDIKAGIPDPPASRA